MRVIGSLALADAGDTTAPTIPQNLNATAINAGRVDLTWTASTDNVGVTGYQIFRNGAALDTTASTSYSDASCQPSTLYSYTVAAFDAAGNVSAESTADTATTPANAAPSWQSVPAQTLIVGDSYTLNLTTYCTDADLDSLEFSITAGTLPTGLSLVGSTISGTSTVAGQTPTITVQAADQFHQISTTIAFQSYNTDVTAPPVPTGLAASAVSASQINVSWNASTDAQGSANEHVSGTQDYRLYRSTDQTNFSLRTTTASTSYSDTGLSASTRYDYKIAARDAELNESSQSSAVNATTEAASSDIFFDDLQSGALNKTMNGWNWGGGVIPAGEFISGFSLYGNTGFCIRNRLDLSNNALIGLNTGGNYQELWLLWVIYMPDGTESPSRGPKMEDGAINGNKLLRVTAIATETSSPYPRFGASMYPGSGTDVLLGPQCGIFPGTGTVSQIGDEVAWCNAANRGRRLVMEWHGKNSTSSGSPNGEQHFWIDGVLVSSNTGLNTFEIGNPGFENCYFFGSVDGPWATNPGTVVYFMYVAASITGRCNNPLA